MGFRIGKSGTPVNTELTDRPAGNPRKHWASGQLLRKRPFYAGFGAGRQWLYRLYGETRQYTPIIFGMGLGARFGEMAADGFRAACMLFCEF